MRALIRGYGRGLTALFCAATMLWAALLIVAPQVAMLEASLLKPARQLDSSVAAQLAADAATCKTVLERHSAAAPPPAAGGLAIPSIGGGLAAPSPGAAPSPNLGVPSLGAPSLGAPSLGAPSLGVPSMGGPSTPGARPYVLQCDRATTRQRLVRAEGEEPAFLDAAYGLAPLAVDATAEIDAQLAQAEAVRRVAAAAAVEIRALEATASPYGLTNYQALFAARPIPLDATALAEDRASLSGIVQRLLGLRFEVDGVVYARLGLVTLATTLLYAACATGLAFLICYPIAFNLALASGPRKAAWLLLALLVPYAIVELMRVYAWLSIVENGGLINRALALVGLVDLEEPIEFKRSPMTVFVVVVYTYVLFMMFPLVNVMSTLDRAQIEAARDLGAGAWRIHWRVVIPHTKPGIAVGCIATFMLVAGAFSVPRIISRGLQAQWYAQTIYDKFFESGAVNVGVAYAVAFTAVCFVLIALFMYVMRARLTDFVRA